MTQVGNQGALSWREAEHRDDYVKRVLATFTPMQVLAWFAAAEHIYAVARDETLKGFSVRMPGKLGGHHSTEWLTSHEEMKL